MKTLGLILCRSDQGDGGWSLHSPLATDDEIANGEKLLLSGTSGTDKHGNWLRPNQADYLKAAVNR